MSKAIIRGHEFSNDKAVSVIIERIMDYGADSATTDDLSVLILHHDLRAVVKALHRIAEALERKE